MSSHRTLARLQQEQTIRFHPLIKLAIKQPIFFVAIVAYTSEWSRSSFFEQRIGGHLTLILH